MRQLKRGKNLDSYSNALAGMFSWNYTTVVRTHYPMKPHIADKKIEQLVKTGCVSNIFFTIEPDRDIKYAYTSAFSVNHLHLLMDVKGVIVDSNVFRKKIANAMGLNPKAVQQQQEPQLDSYSIEVLERKEGADEENWEDNFEIAVRYKLPP